MYAMSMTTDKNTKPNTIEHCNDSAHQFRRIHSLSIIFATRKDEIAEFINRKMRLCKNTFLVITSNNAVVSSMIYVYWLLGRTMLIQKYQADSSSSSLLGDCSHTYNRKLSDDDKAISAWQIAGNRVHIHYIIYCWRIRSTKKVCETN